MCFPTAHIVYDWCDCSDYIAIPFVHLTHIQHRHISRCSVEINMKASCVCLCVCVFVCVCVCVCVCVFCMFVCQWAFVFMCSNCWWVCVHTCMLTLMRVCVCVRAHTRPCAKMSLSKWQSFYFNLCHYLFIGVCWSVCLYLFLSHDMFLSQHQQHQQNSSNTIANSSNYIYVLHRIW